MINDDHAAIARLVLTTADSLDREAFDEWLSLFAPEGVYELNAYGTEIRQTMSWWRADTTLLAQQIGTVKQHVRDPARRRHLLGAPMISVDGDHAHASTNLALYRTTPDGHSSLYLVGRYEDDLQRLNGLWRYRLHRVECDTRMLDMFTHVPV